MTYTVDSWEELRNFDTHILEIGDYIILKNCQLLKNEEPKDRKWICADKNTNEIVMQATERIGGGRPLCRIKILENE